MNKLSEKRKVIVDGTEFEVDIEMDGNVWNATVEGRTFKIEVPDSGPVVKKKRSPGSKKKKSGTVSANIPGKIVTIEVNIGDIVVHSILLLHASFDSQSIEPRLSTDIRFSVNREKADGRWMKYWRGDDGF